MEVEVRVFGLVEKSLGFKCKKLRLEKPITIAEVVKILNLTISDRWVVIAVNDFIRTKTYEMQNGDVVTIHPRCGGG